MRIGHGPGQVRVKDVVAGEVSGVSRVVFDISVSIDGFIADLTGVPDGLHDWAFGPRDGSTALAVPDTWRPDVFGAVIAGWRTYSDSLPSWGSDGPSQELRLPVVVVTHGDVPEPPADGVYSFAHGIAEALTRARALAGSKDVSVMGGGSIGGQFLAAGLLDEIKIHLAPVVLGAGVPLFGGFVEESLRLQRLDAAVGDEAVHLRYRVVPGPTAAD